MRRILPLVAKVMGRCALAVAAMAPAAQASAQQSYFRLYDQTSGLNVGEIAALAQDDTGFIWVGAHRGLVRFDGHNFVAWAPARVDELVSRIAAGPDGELLAGTARGGIWRRTSNDLEALIGPDAKPITNSSAFDFDARGTLWAVLGGELWRRDRAIWQRVTIAAQEIPRNVRAIGDDVVVLTDQAAWRLHDGSPEIVLRQPNLWSVAGTGSSPLWLITHFGRLWRVDSNGAKEIATPQSRVLDLRMRGTTLWISLDNTLVAIAADGRQRRLDLADGLPSGGPLLVDAENSLWLGSFIGLVQFPEPDTLQWGLREGMPSLHAHALVEADGTIWVSTWSGTIARIDEASGTLTPVASEIPSGQICVTDARDVWGIAGTRVQKWDGSAFAQVATLAAPAQLNSCFAPGNGDAWLETTAGVLLSKNGSTPMMVVATEPNEDIDLIWSEGDRFFAVFDNRICQAHLGDGAAGLHDCVAADKPHPWISHAHVGAQRDWLSANDGVFEFDGTSIRRLGANREVEGGIVQRLTPATSGDWWAAGAGALMRIHPCIACATDWLTLERPGLWQGLPGNAALDVVETRDGNLWVAGNRGVWRIPRESRGLPQRAPRIALVSAQIDSVKLDPAVRIELHPADHRLEFEFAALSFRDRSLLRYRSRIGDEGEWSAPTRDPHLQLAALEPGSYSAEMGASLDGEHWSQAPAAISFVVQPPWYRTLWARLLFAACAIAMLTLIYRLRVAALLRVETERTRIAMDLHDEIGAGLGSIGMLAGAAARSSGAEDQQRIVSEIASISNFLGSGLRSLVWSLRSANGGLAELGEQIGDHARRLFPGDAPKLLLRLPGHDSTFSLRAEVRRHTLLLALEAMHNVSKHARATQVSVVLETPEQRSFRLRVEDNGIGFDPVGATAGAGLESMRRRARSIDADVSIASSDAGTSVVLTFPQK